MIVHHGLFEYSCRLLDENPALERKGRSEIAKVRQLDVDARNPEKNELVLTI